METYNYVEYQYKDGKQCRLYKFPYQRGYEKPPKPKEDPPDPTYIDLKYIRDKLPKENEIWCETSIDPWDPETYLPQKRKSFQSSQNRTKNKIYEIARSNTWEYMITFTFNKKYVDRYDYDDISKKIGKWIDLIKHTVCKDLKYLIVPELHKDGAYHFHGLLGNTDGLTFVNSGKIQRNGLGKPVLDDEGNPIIIYNLIDYKLGFSTASRIRNNARATAYITKYITKELSSVTEGKKKYWRSYNLDKPEVIRMLIEDPKNTKDILRDSCEYMKINDIIVDDMYINTVTYAEVDNEKE